MPSPWYPARPRSIGSLRYKPKAVAIPWLKKPRATDYTCKKKKIYNVFYCKCLNHKFTMHETTILHHSLQVPGSLGRKIPPEGAGRAHRKIRPGWGVGPWRHENRTVWTLMWWSQYENCLILRISGYPIMKPPCLGVKPGYPLVKKSQLLPGKSPSFSSVSHHDHLQIGHGFHTNLLNNQMVFSRFRWQFCQNKCAWQMFDDFKLNVVINYVLLFFLEEWETQLQYGGFPKWGVPPYHPF